MALAKAILPGSARPDPDELAGLSPEDWTALVTEGRDDIDVWGEIRPRVDQHLHGLLVVVTFASYLRHAGPFYVVRHDIDTLVRDHAALLDDRMFSGDVTILAPATGTVIAIHHEGALAVIGGRIIGSLEGGGLEDPT